jgi:hypothetical protein
VGAAHSSSKGGRTPLTASHLGEGEAVHEVIDGVALQVSDAVVRRCGGAVVRWCGGAVVRRCGGAAVRRCGVCGV